MVDISALKALSRETKALILVNEFLGRRMPMFQLRSVLDLIIKDDEEKKIIIDLIDNDLRTRGFPIEQVSAFLADLLVTQTARPSDLGDDELRHTRKLRSPFIMGFEAPTDTTGKPMQGVVGGTSFVPRANAPLPPPPVANPVPNPNRGPGSSASRKAVTTSGAQRRSTHLFEPVVSNTVPNVPPARIPIPPGGSGNLPALKPASGPLPAVPPTVPPPVIAPSAPTVAVPPPEGPATITVPPPEVPACGKPVIILAEDDKRARMVFRMRLSEAGFEVIECATGLEAWEQVQRAGISAAVLDMKMPGMHGLQVLSNMAAKQMAIPVVICTAYDQLEDETIVQRYPKLKYLVKPIAPETIIAAIREMIGIKA